jgi:hypothetical protein
LLMYSSYLPLGVSNWTVIYINTPCRIKTLFWRRCRGKRRLLQGEFRTHILYFVLSFVLLYFFYLHHFIKKYKKISFLYSCYFITFSSLCCSLSTFWRTSQFWMFDFSCGIGHSGHWRHEYTEYQCLADQHIGARHSGSISRPRSERQNNLR